MSSLPSSFRVFIGRYVLALGVTFALVLGTIVVANAVIDDKISDIPRIKGLELAAEGPAQAGNFLVIGSDSRAFVENSEEAGAFGTESDTGGQRSDTIMVVHVDPDSKSSLLVSFPRDLWVDIPGQGESKINSAFNDGPQKVIETLNTNFGIEINHYMEVNFKAFVGIVDAIGQVPVYFPAPARDEFTGLNVPVAPGCVPLDGQDALQYVRARNLEYFDAASQSWEDADAIPDLGRIGRQQNFIRRLASVAVQKGSSNPFTALTIADAVIPKLKIDDQLTRGDLLRLVNAFRSVDPNSTQALEMITLPTRGDEVGDQQVLLPVQPDADQIVARLRQFGEPEEAPKGVLPAQVVVRVLNGTGIDGLARRTAPELQQYGFPQPPIGDGTHTDVTEIHYVPGQQKKAELVRSYLGAGVGELVEDKSIVDADVVLLLGTDFNGIVAPAGKSAGSKAPTSTSEAPKSSKDAEPAPTPEAAC